jgi:hypothetical protein
MGTDGRSLSGTSTERQAVVRRKRLLLLALCAVVALIAWVRVSPHAREHWRYLTEKRPSVFLPFDEISDEWSEDQLKAQFPSLTLRCYDNRPGEYVGTRSCFADVGAVNGTEAMNISFYFSEGHLNDLAVNVPWWAHGKAYARLVATFGSPVASQKVAHAGVRLHGWKLPNGSSLFFNRDRAANPMQWSGIVWRSKRVCDQQGCWVNEGNRGVRARML